MGCRSAVGGRCLLRRELLLACVRLPVARPPLPVAGFLPQSVENPMRSTMSAISYALDWLPLRRRVNDASFDWIAR